jgi:hypothetical protein
VDVLLIVCGLVVQDELSLEQYFNEVANSTWCPSLVNAGSPKYSPWYRSREYA